jgi:hypothetical protein
MKSEVQKWLRTALIGCLPAFAPAVSDAATIKITTSDWRISKPSKDFKDLPVLLPKEEVRESMAKAGIGILEFVCMKSKYYMLLMQPSVKLRDAETGTIAVRAAMAPDSGPPIPMTFRNLYKSKTLLSRSFDRDADIHYAEVGPALLASLQAASDLELTLAGKSYAYSLNDLGSRMGSFQRYCEKGVVENPAHFDEP